MTNVLCFVFLVSTMQRMVNQIGTAQDSPDHKQQLYVETIKISLLQSAQYKLRIHVVL